MAAAVPTAVHATLAGHEGAVMAVRYNTQGDYALSGGADRTVRLWNPAKGLMIKSYQAHAHGVLGVCASADNARLASCGGDKQVFFWDVASGQVLRKFRGHDSKVNCVEFGAKGDVLVSGGYDRSVRVWDCRSNSWDPIQTMDMFGDAVTSVCVHEHAIVAGSVDGTVRTFDVRRGEMVTEHLHQPVCSVALSHDGNCVLASRLDSRLLLLERASGEVLNEYTGHVNTQYKIQGALTNTDAHVLSGSEDGQVYFWDLVESGKPVHALGAGVHGERFHAPHPHPI
jgi:mitogen-activated protein kinase organizer 1